MTDNKTKISGPVRVRFAPSPTGYLHVGGARTAIYNELLRRSLGGTFFLRIEDTDRQRSDAAMIEQIESGLRWLGIDWDGDSHLQSTGFERHKAAAEKLLAEGKAYHCFVTPEELDEARSKATETSGAIRYRDVFDRPTREEAERRAANGEPYAIRFPLGDEDVVVHDLVRGDVEFKKEVLDDFVILRSDGSPTYHLSVVCDDLEMGITHVLRGEDHLSNTPKHIGLFMALAGEVPAFGHLPMILGDDRKRLSKRTGAASAEEFREQGMLPQALYNYLALLGWSPGDDREILSKDEMIEAFTVERLGKSASIFDKDKLAWMSSQYILNTPLEDLRPHLVPFLAEVGLEDADESRLAPALELHQSRAKTLRELAGFMVPYFRDQLTYDVEACKKFLKRPHTPGLLDELAARYESLEEFNVETTEAELRELATAHEVGAGQIIHPTRMALSASAKGPPLFDLVVCVGQQEGVRHLRQFATFLRENAPEEG